MTRYLKKLRKLWTRFSLASSETPVQRDWITITFNPQRARATSPRRGDTSRREAFRLPLSLTYRRNCKLNSVFGNAREAVCTLARESWRGGKRVVAIYDWRTCVRPGDGSLCRRTARAIRQNLLPRSDRARTREAALVSREFLAYVTFTSISTSFFFLFSFLSSFRRNVPGGNASAFEGRDRFANRGVSLQRAFAPR